VAITRRSSSKPDTEGATTFAQNTSGGISAVNTVSDYIKEREALAKLTPQELRKVEEAKVAERNKQSLAKQALEREELYQYSARKAALEAREALERQIKENFINSPAGKAYASRGDWDGYSKIKWLDTGKEKNDWLNSKDGLAVQNHLTDQLLAQSKAYGFDWKTTADARHNAGSIANTLALQGVVDLRDLTYDKNGNLQNNEYIPVEKLIKSSLDGKPITPSKPAPIDWYKDDKGQIGWTAKGTGRTNYMVKPDANGNPVFYPDWKSNAPGGIGGFLLKAAPAIVGVATGNPWLAAATSAGIGVASGANFNDIIKNAAITYGSSYLGGKANVATQGALAGLDADLVKAIGAAAQGATQTGASGIATGNFDIDEVLKSALTTGTASGITSLLTDKLPAGQQGPVQPKDITGIAAVDKILPGAAGNLAGQVVAGRDLGDALTSTAIGAASNLAAGQVGGALSGITGNPELDKFLASAGANLTGTTLATFLREQAASSPNRPTAPARPATATTNAAAPTTTAAAPKTTTAAAAPTTTAATTTTIANPATTTTAAPTVNAAAPTTTTPATTAVNGNNNLLNYLSLAGLISGGQSGGTTSAPVLANVKPMDLGWLTPTVNRLYPKKVA
jgi:hypothetical protein